MKLNDEQTALLLELIHYAFVDIRLLGSQGKAEQAADLADAFHNLPKDLKDAEVVLEQFRELYLKPYHEKYPQDSVFNYIKRVNQILERGGKDFSGN